VSDGILFRHDDRTFHGSVRAAGLNYWVTADVGLGNDGEPCLLTLSLKLKDGADATRRVPQDQVPPP
jgi:hypothetical protein